MTRTPGEVRALWVTLEPLSAANRDDVARLDRLREQTPNLGGGWRRSAELHLGFGASMLIRDNRDRAAIGLIENARMAGYPEVASILIFLDQAVARPGLGFEAWTAYVAYVFAAGARLVHFEVMEFNRPVLRILAKLGLSEQVRLREHAYVGGRFWDVLVFALDQARFEQILDRHPGFRGGDRRPPSALGGAVQKSRPDPPRARRDTDNGVG